MSSELGQLFTDGLTYNPSIFDAKTVVVMPGSYIAAIPQTTEFAAARSLDSGGGLQKDEFYWPNAERDKLIPAHWAHRHQTPDAFNGGSYQDIILANMKYVHLSNIGATPEMYYSQVSGTGVIERHPSESGFRIRTGNPSTANSWARVYKGGIGIGFSNKTMWRARMKVNDDLAQLVRWGCNMENPANNADNLEKFGMEGCDGDGPNYRLVTANGIGRHKEPTPFAIEQVGARGFGILLEPGTTVTVQYDDQTQIAETNNIPGAGTGVGGDNVIKFGIKTTNTNDKILTVYAQEALGIATDPDWMQMIITA